MKVMYERVAGTDVHKKMIKVAVRSPGARPWARKTEILTFSTFTACCGRWPATCAAGA